LADRRGDVVLARAVAIGANVGEIAWRDVEPSGGRSVATSAGAVADGAAALGVGRPPAARAAGALGATGPHMVPTALRAACFMVRPTRSWMSPTCCSINVWAAS